MRKRETEDKTGRKTEDKLWKGGGLGTLLVIGIAVVYILLGLAFLLLPELKTKHVCYVIAVLLILAGIIRVGEYFIREYYKNLNQYGFSSGVLLVILGVCTIIKIQQVSGAFTVCLGMGLLLMAIVKVQYAMDTKALKDERWPILLAASCIMVLCASLVLINPFPSTKILNGYTYVVMVLDGIISIISTAYLSYSVKHYEKRLEAEGQALKRAAAGVDLQAGKQTNPGEDAGRTYRLEADQILEIPPDDLVYTGEVVKREDGNEKEI